ncbi:hypothetical protein RSSM_05333 [Rhodopirellula sallentina SM41]|uniref:Uncharacterized protein n=1 Tax=Rhodopirellula sallentina SM41 TaxID=1263870 RepID=M5TW21_9BACT|nr:hypothetical protein RSSM_05333 [Rhodopirellula sallentina SM41]
MIESLPEKGGESIGQAAVLFSSRFRRFVRRFIPTDLDVTLTTVCKRTP